MKKHLNSPITWLILVEVVLVVILYFCGFRITYAPDLENSWDAISAVAEWVGVIVGAIIVPMAVLWIQHKWDNDKQDVATSNLEVIKELTSFKEKYEPLLTGLNEGTVVLDGGNAAGCGKDQQMSIEDKMLQYIAINMGATRADVSEYLNISLATTTRIIKKLVDNGTIEVVGSPRFRKYRIAKRPDKED